MAREVVDSAGLIFVVTIIVITHLSWIEGPTNPNRKETSMNTQATTQVTRQVAPQVSTTTWTIDPAHTVAEFKVKHMMISNVKGQFAKVTGGLTLDESDLTKSHVEATIEASSLETRDAQRDGHLKSEDFLHVDKFPTLSFKSTSITDRNGERTVEGDLTIRGVTRKVRFAVEGPTPAAKDPWGNTRIAVSATTKINRKDFGLTWNTALETGGVLVGDEVTITLDAEFVKA
jgi:polyisoprenoid-binding protein YceI